MSVDPRELQVVDAHHPHSVCVDNLLVEHITHQEQIALLRLVGDNIGETARQRDRRSDQHDHVCIRNEQGAARAFHLDRHDAGMGHLAEGRGHDVLKGAQAFAVQVCDGFAQQVTDVRHRSPPLRI